MELVRSDLSPREHVIEQHEGILPRYLRCVSVLFLTLLIAGPARAQSSADYTLTFSSTWSAATHPVDFPASPHYSALHGVTHDSGFSLWQEGVLASPGIKLMAESGNNSTIGAEIGAAITAGTAQNNIFGSGLGPSPGEIMVSVSMTSTHPLVSVVAMLAPSPDWFIGLNAVELFGSGAWVEDTTVTLYAYDAGTDSGPSYNSPNMASNPFEVIFRIEDIPFLVNSSVVPVGTIRLERDQPLSIETPELEVTPVFIDGPFPNPSRDRAVVRLHLERTNSVRVGLYDLLGRQVETVHDGNLPEGQSEFVFNTAELPAGLYLLRILTPQGSTVRSLSVVR